MKRRKSRKRIVAVLLSFIVFCSVITPMNVLAAEGDVAQIGTQTYATLQEAVDAAAASGVETEIKLIQDVTAKTVISGGNIKLDLNGHVITYKVSGYSLDASVCIEDGNVTLCDSVGTGSINGQGMSTCGVLVNGGSVTIENGYYTCNGFRADPVYGQGGTTIINDGIFDGAVEGSDEGIVTVNGGLFSDLPYMITAGGTEAVLWAPDFDHPAYMRAYPSFQNFAEKNSNTFSYDESTNTLKLLSGYAMDQSDMFMNADVTLDLNSNEIELSNSHLIVINKGTNITVKDSGTDGIIKSAVQSIFDTMGTLNLESGKLELLLNEDKYAGSSAVIVDGAATFNMTGGEISVINNGFHYAYGVSDTQYALDGGTAYINISGGTIQVSGSETNGRSNCVFLNATSMETYCTISGDANLVNQMENQCSIYYNCSTTNPSTVTISGGFIQGDLYRSSVNAKENTEIFLITGGEFSQENITDYVSKSTTVAEEGNKNTPYKIVPNTENTEGIVARISERYYKSLEDAFREVQDGESIVLLVDADGEITISRAATFTVDVNSHQSTLILTPAQGYTQTTYDSESNSYTFKREISQELMDIGFVTLSSPISSLTYTGEERKQPASNIFIRWNGLSITPDRDYEVVSYENVVDAGTATVTVRGIGNYTGELKLNYEIEKARWWDVDVSTPEIQGWTYGETPNQPYSTAKLGQDMIEYYYYSGTNSSQATTDVPVNAGKYRMYAVVPETANWESDTSSTTYFEIAKAAAPVLSDISRIYNADTVKGQEMEVGFSGIPADAGEVNYTVGTPVDDNTILVGNPVVENGVIKFKLSDSAAADNSVTIPVIVTMQNYQDAGFNLTVTLNNKVDQAAPAEFTLEFTDNGDSTSTVTIPEVEGAEYSFDGITWGEVRTVQAEAGQDVTGYIRMKETDTANVSPVTSSTGTAPVYTVKTPKVTPEIEAFADNQMVALSCETADAVIYYTTDGSEPTEQSTEYTEAFTISATTTVKAIAVKEKMNASEVLSITFVKAEQVNAVDATCTDSGNITYWHYNNRYFKDKALTEEITLEETVIPALEHQAVFYPAVDASCDQPGHIAYWYCDVCGTYFEDSNGSAGNEISEDSIAIDELQHSLNKVAAVSADCETDGHIAYWYCDACDKYFADVEGVPGAEISEDTIIIPAMGHNLVRTEAKAADCTEDGNIAYWYCDVCGKYFADENGTTGEEISENSIIIKASGHNVVKIEEKAPTCTENGNKTYWYCDVCGKYFADENLTTEITVDSTIVQVLGHSVEKIPAKAPTATEDGNIEYWYCPVCGKYFRDEALTIEISKEDTILSKTGTEIIPPKEPTDTNTNTPGEATKKPDAMNKAVKTGDISPIGLYIVVVFAAAGAVAVVSRRRFSK